MRGIQRMVGDAECPEPVELITTGWYEEKNGRHTLEYDEVLEKMPGKTHNLITFEEGSALVSKTGQVNADMLFEVGRLNMASYETPYGFLDMNFEATAVHVEKNEEALQLGIAYTMTIGSEVTADCTLDMTVKFQVKKKKEGTDQ